ncbi:MAG: single-stranded DNA-binding protein [bacterium]
MDLNKTMLIGRLTRDPEVRNIPSGQSVASFGLATGRVWKDQSGAKQEKTDFHNIVAWGKLAEICGQYLSKGRQIYIEGRLQTRDWQGQDGVKRYRTEVVAENMIMLGSKPGGGNFASTNPAGKETLPAADAIPTINADEEEEIKVEDIPF